MWQIDPISIATSGYVCRCDSGCGPTAISIASAGYVCCFDKVPDVVGGGGGGRAVPRFSRQVLPERLEKLKDDIVLIAALLAAELNEE